MTAKQTDAAGDEAEIAASFDEAVNMTPSKLESWLETEESGEVGFKSGGEASESVGHHSGRRIVEIKRRKVADRTADDIAHMHKVVSYVHRHLAQRPKGDITQTRWRYSLMNWGHDPAK
ncbi:DNA-binding protein [Aureimonas sp. Leaf454]|uniref:DUF3140 domain-containing protein n=1 Tax=Aureimonas sp. Leaf454 TaxID=1736381 RepID=UPI0006F4EA65|nr:DUF3140 domain-containing protein [Aureimonas sp. Leaf454]KQT53127.1 DNA-binding protein [Aureimonas sp. Leaf454]